MTGGFDGFIVKRAHLPEYGDELLPLVFDYPLGVFTNIQL